MRPMLSEMHAQHLEKRRHISAEVAARANVVSRADAIGFQYLDRGTLRFTKWRGPNKRFWIEPSGERLMLWNLDSLRGESAPEMVIITEGEMDALSWLTAGAPFVVSVPNGAPGRAGEGDIVPTEDDQFAYLWDRDRIIPELASVKKIVIATDADRPGRILAEELAIRLGRERCWLVEYPEGCKDTNDVLVRDGLDGVHALLEGAKCLWPTELVSVMDIPPNPLSISHSTGWKSLDEHLQLVPPELAIVTGTPNSGKSQWVWCLACQMARLHGWKIAVVQFEDSPERLRDSLLAYARTWSKSIPLDAEDWVRRSFLTPKPEDADGLSASERTMRWVLDRIKEAGWRHGCRMVIVDPWNEIEHDWQKQYTETQYISRMLKLLKQAARRYSVAIVLIAHPKGSSFDKPVDELTLNDVSGGMAWNAKADHGIIVHRSAENPQEVQIKVSKSRDHQRMGRPGVVTMHYNPRTCFYTAA